MQLALPCQRRTVCFTLVFSNTYSDALRPYDIRLISPSPLYILSSATITYFLDNVWIASSDNSLVAATAEAAGIEEPATARRRKTLFTSHLTTERDWNWTLHLQQLFQTTQRQQDSQRSLLSSKTKGCLVFFQWTYFRFHYLLTFTVKSITHFVSSLPSKF